MDDSVWWALYRGLRLHLGEWKHWTLFYERKRWYSENKYPVHCTACGHYIPNKKDRTIDHIIPVKVCMELELPLLIFDRRNFQMLCKTCNTKKADKLHGLSAKIQKALRRRERELELKTQPS